VTSRVLQFVSAANADNHLSSASSDFLNPLPKMVPQTSPQTYGIGVFPPRRDRLNTFGGRFQQMSQVQSFLDSH
jgi:hypothetical protein